MRGGENIIKYDNLIRFNRMLNYIINHPHFANGGDQSDIDHYDDNNKEYLRKARNYEIVTSSEMVAIMPTSPAPSFAETFCDIIGYGDKNNIAPSMKYHECLTNVEWFDSPYDYMPKSITFAPEYEC